MPDGPAPEPPSPPSRPPPTDEPDEPDDLAKLRRENASRRKHERELEGQLEGALAHIAKQDVRDIERSANALGFRDVQDVHLFLGDRSHLAGEDGIQRGKYRNRATALNAQQT